MNVYLAFRFLRAMLNPDTFFIAISICETLSFLATSMIFFRFLIVSVSIAYIIGAFWAGLSSPGMKSIMIGAVFDLGLNVFMISVFFFARMTQSLPVEWRNVYRRFFGHLEPHEFKYLLKIATALDLSEELGKPQLIVTAGSPFQALYFIVGGVGNVLLNGSSKVLLRSGDWISELSFITGKPVSADVSFAGGKLLKWDAQVLGQLEHKKPDLYQKLNGMIASNVCDKLVRSNEPTFI